jgi:hypothetical protein
LTFSLKTIAVLLRCSVAEYISRCLLVFSANFQDRDTMAALVTALTTTFTPSPYCTNEYWRVNETGTYSQDNQINTYQYMTLGPPSTSDCFPTGYNEAKSIFYSPGVCPDGYTEACSSTVNVGTLTETRATCCPRFVTLPIPHRSQHTY